MLFRTFQIKTSLTNQSILNALQAYSYPIDSAWHTNEFDNKTVLKNTYAFKGNGNAFKLRARKTNQRRKSRPLCYGKIITEKNKTKINALVIPHIGSLIIWSMFFLTMILLIAVAEDLSKLISGLLFFIGGAVFFYLKLKYDTKDIEVYINNVLKDYDNHQLKNQQLYNE